MMELTDINGPKRTVTLKGRCPFCDKPTEITVNRDSYVRWKGGMLVQDAFPDLSDDDRELLISSIHPQCWPELPDDI